VSLRARVKSKMTLSPFHMRITLIRDEPLLLSVTLCPALTILFIPFIFFNQARAAAACSNSKTKIPFWLVR